MQSRPPLFAELASVCFACRVVDATSSAPELTFNCEYPYFHKSSWGASSMHTQAAVWLLNALVVAGLGIAFWFVLSWPAIWIKQLLQTSGFLAVPSRLASFAQRTGPDSGAVAVFFARANESMVRNGDQAMVRVALDERHEELRARLTAAEQVIREAVGQVQGLAGSAGESNFLRDIADLRERTKAVENIESELPPTIEEDYARRRQLNTKLTVLTPLLIVIGLANGALLSVLFNEMTSMKLFGTIPLAYGFGVVAVALEVGIGSALYHFRSSPLMMLVCVLLVVGATAFEVNAMATFSVEFSTSQRGVDPSEATLRDYWMVLLGLVFTPMTSILGYMWEQSRSEKANLNGKLQLRDELKRCNDFVAALPQVWINIDKKARSAEAAIERFQDALGGQGDRLAGAIDSISEERKLLSRSILAARVEDWPTLIEGAEGDSRNAAVQNLFLCVATIAALAAYAVLIWYLVARATRLQWPLAATAAIGVIAAMLFLVVGNLAFNRLRLTQGSDGRAQPMSAQPYHKAVALVLVAGCAAGIMWVATVALGRWGIVAGIFVTVLGGVLSFLGYGIERAARGLVLLTSITTALCVAIAATALSIMRYVALWIVASATWFIGFVVQIAARPAEIVRDLIRDQRLTAAAGPAKEGL